MAAPEPAPFVLGRNAGNFLSRKVRIVGRVENTNPSTQMATLLSADGVNIMVQNAQADRMYQSDIVEISGVMVNAGMIREGWHTNYAPGFNMQQHVQLVTMMHGGQLGELYTS